MNIFVTDQQRHFSKLLKVLQSKPAMTFDKSKLKETISSVDIISNKPFAQLDLSFLFAYKIFPSSILTYLTQWENEKREMRTGDTILQQVFIPPVKSLSQKIVFGVRINQIIDEPFVKGFSYETIEGHVEKGESTFTVEELDSKLTFSIRTYSEPGNLLTRLLGPIFTLPYQSYCTRRALENVKRQLEERR